MSNTNLDLYVTSSPHLSNQSLSTRGLMLDVVIGLLPAVGVSIYVFGWFAVWQIGLCVLSCMAFETVFELMRSRRPKLDDCSAIVTGLILALSLPWSAPWFIGVIGSLIAMGLGKAVFGGLGCNLFNPAMVGRAFVMLSFSSLMAAGAYVGQQDKGLNEILTQATPMTLLKSAEAVNQFPVLMGTDTVIGQINGSLGETSVIALLLGGVFLCLRKTATWDVPLAALASVFVFAALFNWGSNAAQFGLAHVLNGAIILGAFFIATDPVTNPMTTKGRIIFGIGFGFLTVVLRCFSSYPEGVMFAILLMNAVVPLINRATIPQPFGAVKPAK